MAYCTVDDVQPYLIHITLSDTSQPTKEQVSQLCSQVSNNIIDPIIRNYLTLPLEDKVGLAYLRQGAIWGVVSQVMTSIHGITVEPTSWDLKFDNFLEMLRTNNAVLIKPNDDFPKASGTTRRDAKYTLDSDEDIW